MKVYELVISLKLKLCAITVKFYLFLFFETTIKISGCDDFEVVGDAVNATTFASIPKPIKFAQVKQNLQPADCVIEWKHDDKIVEKYSVSFMLHRLLQGLS